MELIILLPTVLIIEMGIEAYLTSVGRKRGLVVPWNVSFESKPPRCTNERLNQIERILLVVIAPLGLLLVFAGGALAFTVDDTLGAAAAILGFLFLCARGLFVAACFAYADLADAPANTSQA
ncbi:MAG: hypothetical protein JHC98_11105 [Thermoleophilaceae bacterium]|nr:hypothetical protein [Thermoleophilaceae bacterium]